MKKFGLISIILPLLILSSCNDDKDYEREYNVESSLEPYLEKFLTEAALRGYTYDLQHDGIIVKYSDLESPTIGLCTYSDPIKVEFDKTYWAKTEGQPNQEDLRLNLVFHELAHGLLKRQHLNTLLENTEWKSLMCGTPPASDKDWSVNFNGARKEYYIDELFDLNTPAPEYTKRITFSGEKGEISSQKDFSNEADKNQRTTSNNVTSSIKNGVWNLYNETSSNVTYAIEYAYNSDFFFEIDMTQYLPNEYSFAGLIVASKSGATNYFLFNNEGVMVIGNTNCTVQDFAQIDINDLLKNKTTSDFLFENNSAVNTFALQKNGDELSFYINDVRAYWNDYKLSSYDIVGIVVPQKGYSYISSYKFYQNESNSMRSYTQKDDFIKPIITPKER